MSAEAAVSGISTLGPIEATTLPSRGRVGILVLILTESVFFSIFVAAYVFYIGKSLSGPMPRDVLAPPILNTICLLSSSITIVLAIRALQAGSIRTFGIWWLATLALGIAFMIGTARDCRRLIYVDHLTIRTN